MDNKIQFTIKLSEDQVKTLNTLLLTRKNESMDSLIQQCLNRGIKDLDYRTDRNKRIYNETKEAIKLYRSMNK